MAQGINKVILIGNLGANPDVKYLPSGDAVCNISLATSESWNDKQTGEKKEKTEWHRVVAFRRLGEIIGQYCKKGSKIYIEGRLQTRKWQDKQGVDHYSTEIIADNMQMLDSRSGGESSFESNQYQNSNQYKNSNQYQNAAINNNQQNYENNQQSFASKNDLGAQIDNDDFDDDIPF